MDLLFVFSLTGLILFISVFPDVDLKKSKIRDFISISIAFAVAIVYIYFYRSTWIYGLIYFIFVYLIFRNLPTKHRGISHTFKFSLFFSLMIVVLIYFIIGVKEERILFWFLVVFSSYTLHLVLDRI
jgi:hypothetical protein